jgi:hypothetical protein
MDGKIWTVMIETIFICAQSITFLLIVAHNVVC